MLYSDSLLGYSTGERETLQLIVRVVYGAVDYPLASCMFVHFLFWKWNLKWLWVCKFHKLEVSFFTVLICFTYIVKPHNVIILYFPFPNFMSPIMLYFLHSRFVFSFYIEVVFTLSIYMYITHWLMPIYLWFMDRKNSRLILYILLWLHTSFCGTLNLLHRRKTSTLISNALSLT